MNKEDAERIELVEKLTAELAKCRYKLKDVFKMLEDEEQSGIQSKAITEWLNANEKLKETDKIRDKNNYEQEVIVKAKLDTDKMIAKIRDIIEDYYTEESILTKGHKRVVVGRVVNVLNIFMTNHLAVLLEELNGKMKKISKE